MFRLFKCSAATTPMLPRNEPIDVTSPNANHRSFLVTLSARAIGSLGFGLSILAIGLRWLVPLAVAVTPGVVDKPKQRANHRSRRRLALAISARQVVRQQTTSPITMNEQRTTSNSDHDKHIYFADVPGSHRSPTPTSKPVTTLHDSLTEPEENHPPPTTSTPPKTPPSLTDLIPVKRDDESILESDSSRRSSLSFHLPKRIINFGNKSRQHGEPSPTVIQSLSCKKNGRRSNIGFVPSWSSRRKSLDTPSGPNDDTSGRSLIPLKSAKSASSSSQPSVVSYFSLKTHHRRTSAPTTRMRTQPYDAPYFALPPTSAALDSRKSPPMLQEALINSTMQQASGDNRGRPLQSPRQPLTKRRSASEGWNNGRRTMKMF